MDPGVQETGRPPEPENSPSLQALLRRSAEHYSEQPALSCLGHTLSYRRLDQLSDALAAWLQIDAGLEPGDRVAVQLPNLLQYPVAALAVLKAGMVLVNVNPLYTAAELQYQLQNSGARVLIVLANFAHRAAEILPGTEVGSVLVTEAGDLHPPAKRLLMNFVLRHVRKQVPAYAFPHMTTLPGAITRGRQLLAQHARPEPDCDRETLALLQYTGGTTGVSKAAMLTHGNLLSNVAQLLKAFNGTLPGPRAVMVTPLPLYHIYAFTLGMLGGLVQGHHLLLIPNPRDQKAFVRALRAYRVNGFLGINTLYRMLCANPEFRRLDFSALQISSAGGMALSPEVVAEWKAVTGSEIIEGYGLSECSPMLFCNTCTDLRPGTVGRVVPDTEVSLRDSEGRQVATGEPGEVCVRGPQVMRGYWRHEAENARVFDEQGWFHTGDIGMLDTEGYLRIVDRIKDVIIISGFNVYPNELEEHVCRHPRIVDACAVGIGEEHAAEIKLFVVCEGDLGAEEIIAFCREGLAAYKVPRHVEFRTQLPKSPVGKVLRRELREQESSPPPGPGA